MTQKIKVIQYSFRESDRPYNMGLNELDETPKKKAKVAEGLKIGALFSGKAKFYFDGKYYDLNAGDCWFADSSFPHCHQGDGAGVNQILYVHMTRESIQNLSPEPGDLLPMLPYILLRQGLPPVVKNHDEMVQLLKNGWKAFSNKKGDYKLKSWPHVLQALVALTEHAENWMQSQGDPHSRFHAKFLMIASAVQHLEKNYTQPVSVEEIASNFSMSSSRFAHLFSEIMGDTIIGYRNRLRIMHSAELLLSTDLQIEEISEQAGFQDYSHFRISFRKIFSVSPREWRKQNRMNLVRDL